MIKKENLIFTNLYGFNEPSINFAMKRGDWKGTSKIPKLSKQEIIDKIKDSGLRGRGGAGFSTGMKWDLCLREVLDNIIWSLMQTKESPVLVKIAI